MKFQTRHPASGCAPKNPCWLFCFWRWLARVTAGLFSRCAGDRGATAGFFAPTGGLPWAMAVFFVGPVNKCEGAAGPGQMSRQVFFVPWAARKLQLPGGGALALAPLTDYYFFWAGISRSRRSPYRLLLFEPDSTRARAQHSCSFCVERRGGVSRAGVCKTSTRSAALYRARLPARTCLGIRRGSFLGCRPPISTRAAFCVPVNDNKTTNKNKNEVK